MRTERQRKRINLKNRHENTNTKYDFGTQSVNS